MCFLFFSGSVAVRSRTFPWTCYVDCKLIEKTLHSVIPVDNRTSGQNMFMLFETGVRVLATFHNLLVFPFVRLHVKLRCPYTFVYMSEKMSAVFTVYYYLLAAAGVFVFLAGL